MSSSNADPRFYHLLNAMFDDWNVAEALISADPSIVHARSGIGETALHYLAVENHLEGVAWLFERGADINTRDDFDSTPLIAGAQLGHLELCRFLLDKSADIFAMDHIGRTAISMVSDLKPKEAKLLEMLLAHKGDADINLFFDDVEAESTLTMRGSRVADFWRGLGLRSRYDDPPLDFEAKEN